MLKVNNQQLTASGRQLIMRWVEGYAVMQFKRTEEAKGKLLIEAIRVEIGLH